MAPYNRVIPQVYYSSNDAVGVDSPSSAFSKYNNHEHTRASVGDFRFQPIQIGDSVHIYDQQGNDIYLGANPPVVNYITGSKLRVSLTSAVTLNNVILYAKAPRGDSNAKLIFGVNTVEGSQEITLSTPLQTEEFQQKEGAGLPGFISQSQLERLSSDVVTHILSPSSLSSGNIFLALNLPYDAWILAVSWFNNSGQTNLTLKYKDPINSSQNYSSFSNWYNYSAPVTCSAGYGVHNFLDKLEEPLSNTFPTGKPTKYIPKGSSILLNASTALSASLTLSLHLSKILS